MIHTEILDQFILQNLKEGDLVEIGFNDETIITGCLSSGKVFGELNESGEVINSRIGVTPPPPPPGKIYSRETYPIYSEKIKRITKL